MAHSSEPTAEGSNATNRLDERIEEMGAEIHGRAQGFKERVSEKADMATSRVGRKIESVSQAMRERAPEEGRMHGAASAVADRLERMGSYLQRSDVQAMTEDLSASVRRHPVRSALVAVGIGYLLGRIFTRKR